MSDYSRRDLLRAGLRTAPWALLASGAGPAWGARKDRRPRFNVLFIAIDDLRPYLGCYGQPQIQTPNIDRIAEKGLTFTRAYCQQADSSPSRTSLMTGLRPDTTQVYDLTTHFRRRLPRATTLPQQFRKHGYTSTAFGKIFHKPQLDDLPSWSIAPWMADSYSWGSQENTEFSQRRWAELQEHDWVSTESFSYEPEKRPAQPSGDSAMPSWADPDVADDALTDGKTAGAAIAGLDELQSRRFFLAIGFLRPHLPFVAPKKYYDRYPKEQMQLADNPEPPEGAPPYALHNSPELRRYSDIPPSGPIPDSKAKELIRGYYASVSYVDAQIGRLLDALETRGLWENTVIVLWGDHGYHLGEHGLWNKDTNFEAATRSPLIVSVPGQKGAGRRTAALAEFVDIYPSLCQICQVPRPLGLEGSSFVPLFEDPDRLWKRAVFSQYPREIPGVGPAMGYSMRTQRYRYTEWTVEGSPNYTAELYDYETDPLERRNIANRPENVSLANGLSGMLKEGWRGSLPPTASNA